MDIVRQASSLLNMVGKTIDAIKNNLTNHFEDNSITKLTKLTSVTPITVVSQDCVHIPYLPQIMDSLCSLYASYYCQGVAILTQASANIEVVKTLDALSPDRDETGFLLQGRLAQESVGDPMVLAMENYSDFYKFSLPVPEQRQNIVMAAENFDRETVKVVYETSNLAVGKLINVRFQVGNRQVSFTEDDEDAKDPTSGNAPAHDADARFVTIPVSFRLSPAVLDNDSISYLFSHRKEDRSITERWYKWRAGRISFVSDVIFNQDLITEYRRAALKDRTGTLQEITRRVSANRNWGLLSRNASMNVASNIYVLSAEAAREIEGRVGSKFSDARGREKLLEDTYAMIICIIDTQKELVSYYFNGIALPATQTVRSIKASSKNNDQDLSDIMTSLLNGRTPTF